MATPSTNGADPGKDGRAEPRRLRWSVPRVDISTNRWLDEQNDISHSLQLLIRDSIQRDGYIDVVNRPIEQLPRRGRPPQSDAADDPAEERSEYRAEDALVQEEPQSAPAEPGDEGDAQSAQEPQQRPAPAKPAASGLDAFLTS